MKGERKMFSKIIICLLVSILSFSSIYTESTDYEYTIFSSNKNEIIDPNLLTKEQRIGQIAEDYFKLKKENNEVVGWINIPNVCFYPILYSGDQKYLRKDVYGNYSYAGSIFMNKNSKGTFENTALLHGHHMKNGTMFAGLKQYEYEDFFRQNECIEVFDGKNLYYYKPYTVLYIEDGVEFIEQQLEGEERANYFKSLYERSIVKMEEGLIPDFNKNMLYLSTCEYLFNNCRLVVGCYLVKTVPYQQ